MKKNKLLVIIVVTVIIISISLSYHFFIDEIDGIKEDFPRVNIVFDRTHSQYWSIWNPGIMGYSKMAELLIDHGFNVSQNNIPLDKRVRSMESGDILFLGVASSPFSNYTENELKEIDEFVKRGGKLIVTAEHENLFGLNDFQNKLANRYGVHFRDDLVINEEDNIERSFWPKAESDLFDLENIGFWGTCSLNYPSSAQELATVEFVDEEGDRRIEATVVGLDVQDGRIAFIGDTHPFWNGKEDMGIDYGENREFTIKLMEYLIGRDVRRSTFSTDYKLYTGETFELELYFENKQKLVNYDVYGGNISSVKKEGGNFTFTVNVREDGFIRFRVPGEPHQYVHFLKPNTDNLIGQKILFDTRNYGRTPGRGPSGLFQFASMMRDEGFQVFAGEVDYYTDYDAIVLSAPMRSYLEEEIELIFDDEVPTRSFSEDDIDNIKHDLDKILLFGNYHTSLQAEDMGVYDYIKNWEGWVVYDYPLNDIGKPLGVEFSYHTIVDSESDTPFMPKICYSGNQSHLFYSSSLFLDGNFSVIHSSENTYGEIKPWEHWDLSRGKYDLDGPLPVVAWNEQVFASGDISLIENQNIEENKWFVEHIIDWIQD